MLRKTILYSLLYFFSNNALGQTDLEISNLSTFAKVYGYVKYFHPSDEAAGINWDLFAIYGCAEVEKCKTQQELRETLIRLFRPLAPSMKIYQQGDSVRFDLKEITPVDHNKYKVIAWQHIGVNTGIGSMYQSARTNRPLIIKEEVQDFGVVSTVADTKKYPGDEFVFTAKVKVKEGNGTGHLWARVDLAGENNPVGFFDNMDDRPISVPEWQVYRIEGNIDSSAKRVVFGGFLSGRGELLIDSMVLQVHNKEGWEIAFSEEFKNDPLNKYPMSLGNPQRKQTEYDITVQQDGSTGGKCVSIKSSGNSPKEKKKAHSPLFKKYPHAGEYINKDIGSGLSCIIPLALYGKSSYTFPEADAALLSKLKENLQQVSITSLSPENRHLCLANIIITWNLMQHFYPYLDVAGTNWDEDLSIAMDESYAAKNLADFDLTFRKFLAKLKDGHLQLYSPAISGNYYYLPISWEWISDTLIVTKVLKENTGIESGDIVTHIDGIPAVNYFREKEAEISAATEGHRKYLLQRETLSGKLASQTVLRLLTSKGQQKELRISRILGWEEYDHLTRSGEKTKKISDSIYYINLDKASWGDIKKIMPDLTAAKAIICDLRGYPNDNDQFIKNLLIGKDTSRHWMQIPEIIYPDQVNIAGYRTFGWNMRPAKPHLNAKIIFITDGRAISYAESFMSFIENYKLATIIGQPTAGTNGNINPVTLPGGYSFYFTGMKVVKHDGSQHHGIGTIPDIYLYKTIKGVREGRDEFLERAIQIAKE